ncbi:MAG: hypothetical protein ACPLPR_03365 [Bacillota bacterium]
MGIGLLGIENEVVVWPRVGNLDRSEASCVLRLAILRVCLDLDVKIPQSTVF